MTYYQSQANVPKSNLYDKKDDFYVPTYLEKLGFTKIIFYVLRLIAILGIFRVKLNGTLVILESWALQIVENTLTKKNSFPKFFSRRKLLSFFKFLKISLLFSFPFSFLSNFPSILSFPFPLIFLLQWVFSAT